MIYLLRTHARLMLSRDNGMAAASAQCNPSEGAFRGIRPQSYAKHRYKLTLYSIVSGIDWTRKLGEFEATVLVAHHLPSSLKNSILLYPQGHLSAQALINYATIRSIDLDFSKNLELVRALRAKFINIQSALDKLKHKESITLSAA